MVVTIHYPADAAEWYAKGTALGNIYFEVPAVFDANGLCDTVETDTKVELFLAALSKGVA